MTGVQTCALPIFDQLLILEPATLAGCDFSYRIYNADGDEVEHCGNGARCFVRFVREQGLTTQTQVRVKVKNGILTLHEQPDGQVKVDMGAPVLESPRIPFLPTHAVSLDPEGLRWRLSLPDSQQVDVSVVSMGNPHAVTLVGSVAQAPEIGRAHV